MSIWVTPAGSIGTYTQQRQFTFDFQATTSLGGRIVYEIKTPWPPGSYVLRTIEVSPGVFVGRLTATPAYVNVPTSYSFDISATEVNYSGSYPNVQTFSLTVSNTVWQTNTDLGIFIELDTISVQLEAQPSIPGNRVSYELLNGALPASQNINSPLTLTTVQLPVPDLRWVAVISGTLGQVNDLITNTFTVRASELNGLNQVVSFRDRTFNLTVSGTTAPRFTSPAGTVLFSTQDSTWVSYEMQYSNPDPNTSVVISLASGSLPPGLEITSDGIIRGYADPPVTSTGSPTTTTYTFTLKITSESGENLAAFSITVINQQTLGGFSGRQPTILNTQPLTITIDPSDPYAPYYLATDSLGNITSDNYYIFKFIGYDFDGDGLTYEVLPADVFANLGLVFNTATGWVTGVINESPLPSVDTYNFIVSVYKTSDPSIRSQNFKFSITIVNNIDLRIEWLTDSDLGVINNGSTSVKNVQAVSLANKTLSYRLVGNDFTTDLFTVVHADSEFQAFGRLGGYVQSADPGTQWVLNTNNFLTEQQFTILSSVFDPFNNLSIVVGFNLDARGIFAYSANGTTWNYNFAPTPITSGLRGIAFNNNNATPKFVSVGDDGYAMYSTDGVNWTYSNTGVIDNLTSVYYDGTQFIAVGERGTLLTTPDGITWVNVVNTFTTDFNSVAWTGTNWVIVGDLGLIIIATDISNPATWTFDNVFPNFDYIKIIYAGKLVAVGTQGAIITSINEGVNWTVENSGTINNLADIIFDNVSTLQYWVVGEAGSVFTSTDAVTWTSPTITSLPPNLVLEPNGDIVGRLAFESKSTVQPINTNTVYNFTVQAYSTDPGFEEIVSTKQFTLTTFQKFALPYDSLYIKALVSQSDRDFVDNILYDETLIPASDVYRADDPYFGRAKSVIYQHMFGVPSIASEDFFPEYIAAVQENHYWRNIVLGPLKTAIARNEANEIIYEVVYSEIVDNLINAQGQSISKQITWPRPIDLNLGPYITSTTTLWDSMTYYDPTPTVKTVTAISGNQLSIENVEGLSVGMVVTGYHITTDVNNAPPVVVSITPGSGTNIVQLNVSQPSLIPYDQVVFNDPVITSNTDGTVRVLYPNSLPNMRAQIQNTVGFINDTSLLPLWMSSQQANGSVIGFTQAWVLCYTLPGKSQTVAENINNYMQSQNRYLNSVDFKIDRFEVDRSLTYGFEGGTATNPIWNDLPSPSVIGDSQNSYIYFPRKTILPLESQE